MAPGSDWLANIFLGTFLFGLVFTVVSVFLGAVHIGGLGNGHHIHVDAGGHHIDVGGHNGGFGHHGGVGHHVDVGHHAGGPHHVDVGHHADTGHHTSGGQHVGLGHQADIHIGGHGGGENGDATHNGPGILNMPTIMAFLTWFGGAGYIFTRTLGLAGIITVPLALISGLLGGGIMFVLLARLLWPMMSKPLSKADYHLPGTPARVVSPIRADGVGEIVYTKGGSRFTAGARSVGEEPVAKGAEVVILRYERGIAYVQSVDDILNGKDLANSRQPSAISPESSEEPVAHEQS
jgi:hypothetical protein